MKKLIIAAAFICAAAVSQAAATYWTCTYVAKSAENYVNGGVAYFVVGGTTVRDSILALAGEGAASVSAGLDEYYSYTGGTDGNYGVKSASAVENSTLGLTDSTKGNNAFLVIFDTSTITDSSNFYVTEVKSFDTMGGTNKGQIKWGDQETASSAKGAWNAVSDVPEPTSGMLLLLGMAGLALRRRRA